MQSKLLSFLEARFGADTVEKWNERIRRVVAPGTQSRRASDLWASLEDYELYFTDKQGHRRSEWLAEQVGNLGIRSVLEIGTNSGRNLAVIHEAHPHVSLKGIDVNERAIAFAQKKSPDISFAIADANHWSEPEKSWDAIITMSLIDHIPEEAMQALARNMVATARKYIMCVELWDQSEGWRGQYKYSRDLRRIFEPLGVKTLNWAPSNAQYNADVSYLYAYIGEVGGLPVQPFSSATRLLNRLRPPEPDVILKPPMTDPARKQTSVTLANGEVHPISTYVDPQGRQFSYVHIRRPEAKNLLVHFTAFFGDWGDRKEYKELYQGYFHRLKIFGDQPEYSSLFLCDEYGHTHNGTYYTGEKGDFFVERAMNAILDDVQRADGIGAERVVMVGSSMGATGALKFGLMRGAGGVIAISPHIDLDISAEKQGRMDHVAFVVPDGDPLSEANHRYTRQIRGLLQTHVPGASLPRLYVHACADDHGVYREQILPLAGQWRAQGGEIILDIRPDGGHTSDFATKALLTDVVTRLFAGQPIDPLTYRQDKAYFPKFSVFNQPDDPVAPVEATGPFDLGNKITDNAGTSQFMLAFAIDRLRARSTSPVCVVFYGTIDADLLAGLRRDVETEDIEVFALDAAGSFTSAEGTPVAAEIFERFATVLAMKYAFYGISRDRSVELLAGLPRSFDVAVLIDQTDNWQGQDSSVLTLRDSDDREYAAECHDFGTLLAGIGLENLTVQPMPRPSKSLTGVIVAERTTSTAVQEPLREFFERRAGFDPRRHRGTRIGQFIIPACAEGNVRIRAFLRNTQRLGEGFPLPLRKLGMPVELRIFRDGVLIEHDPAFARIPLNGVVEISDATCPALAGDQRGILIVARCSLPSDGPTYFGQEHQLCYESAKSSSLASVLYDQLPVIVGDRPQSQIVLLAPKAWVGRNHNAFVVFASTNSRLDSSEQERPLDVTVLDADGNVVASETISARHNAPVVVDVRKMVGTDQLSEAPRLLNVVAKGGAAQFAIVTFVVNDATGNMALEHSLSPHYYVSTGLDTVRAHALSSFSKS